MSKAYEMIAGSLNEIINDLEETGGKNLSREKMSLRIAEKSLTESKPNLDKYIANKPSVTDLQIGARG